MAMACLRLVTFLRERPERNFPCFISRMLRSTFLPAFAPYFLRPAVFLRVAFLRVAFLRPEAALRVVVFLRAVLFLRVAFFRVDDFFAAIDSSSAADITRYYPLTRFTQHADTKG